MSVQCRLHQPLELTRVLKTFVSPLRFWHNTSTELISGDLCHTFATSYASRPRHKHVQQARTHTYIALNAVCVTNDCEAPCLTHTRHAYKHTATTTYTWFNYLWQQPYFFSHVNPIQIFSYKRPYRRVFMLLAQFTVTRVLLKFSKFYWK